MGSHLIGGLAQRSPRYSAAMPERRLYKGAWIEVVTEEVTLPGGRRATLDMVRHPGASAVVPFLDDVRVLLIRQYRYAASGEIYEVPAGKLDPGEAPAVCAARELEEETGYRAGRLEGFGPIWTTPGFTDEKIHLFAAFDLSPGEQRLEDDELIELVPMPFGEALEMVWSGQLSDAKSALALLHTAKHLGRLG